MFFQFSSPPSLIGGDVAGKLGGHSLKIIYKNMTNPTDQNINVAIPAHIVPEYCNMVNIAFNKEEFSLNFIKASPPQAVMSARIISSPGHIKRISQLLVDVVKQYEDQFGAIDPAEQISTIGFKDTK